MSSIVVTGSIHSNWGEIYDQLRTSLGPGQGLQTDLLEWAAGDDADAGYERALQHLATNGGGDLHCIGAEQLVQELNQIHRVPNDTYFVIACSSPEQAVIQHLWGHADSVQNHTASIVLATWKSQIRGVLDFAYRFRERCLLVVTKACLDDPGRLQQALKKRFGIHAELTTPKSTRTVAQPSLARLIASCLIADELGVDELYDELEAACNLLPRETSVGAGLNARHQQALEGSVDEYREVAFLRAELEMAAIELSDLHRELEERYQDIDNFQSQLATMASFMGEQPTLSLLRRSRARQNA